MITADEYPAIKIITSAEIELFSMLFGPFKDKYAAENLLIILREILLIRTCVDSVPTNKCINSSIGKCSGPCKKTITQIEYQKIIDVAIEFLQGNSDSIIEIINQDITKATAVLQFEDAAKLRDIRDFCLNSSQRQRFISDFLKEDLIIKSLQINRTFLFQNGLLIKIYKQKPTDKMINNCFQMKRKINIINPHYLMDRAYVVWVWMKRDGGKSETY